MLHSRFWKPSREADAASAELPTVVEVGFIAVAGDKWQTDEEAAMPQHVQTSNPEVLRAAGWRLDLERGRHCISMRPSRAEQTDAALLQA